MGNKIVVSGDVLFFAFRYALGRATYASSSVSDSIKENMEQLSNAEIQNYVREIEEASEGGLKKMGMEMDSRTWLELRNVLVGELNNREIHHER